MNKMWFEDIPSFIPSQPIQWIHLFGFVCTHSLTLSPTNRHWNPPEMQTNFLIDIYKNVNVNKKKYYK